MNTFIRCPVFLSREDDERFTCCLQPRTVLRTTFVDDNPDETRGQTPSTESSPFSMTRLQLRCS